MKIKSVLSIILAFCLMASFVFCAPVQAVAAAADLESSQRSTEQFPEGEGETENAPEGEGETETAPEASKGSILDILMDWFKNGLPWQFDGFLTSFDKFFDATINFGVEGKHFAGNTYTLIKYLIDLFF